MRSKINKTDIINNAVTYEKIQKATADKVILGNVSGADEDLVELDASQAAGLVRDELLIDEDDFASDSDTKAPTQQSTKAYVDAQIPEQDVVLLDSQTVSGVASVDFTGLSSDYHTYELRCSNVSPTVNARDFGLRFSSDGGSNWDSGSSDYTTQSFAASNTSRSAASSNGSYISLSNPMGALANELVHTVVTIFNPSASTYSHVRSDYTQINSSGNPEVGMRSGYRLSTSSMDAVQVLSPSANINGTFKLYGYK